MSETLFLDIDGVLNGHRAHGNGYCGIESKCVEQLNRILAACPNVKIVVSSAWRYIHGGGDMTRRGFEYLLASHGVDSVGRIVGFTESDESTVAALEGRVAEPNGVNGAMLRRIQIRRYADQRNLRSFVVLDDLDLDMPELVRTEPGIGLTAEDAGTVISRLSPTQKAKLQEGMSGGDVSDPLKELCDFLEKNKIGILFWTCPKGCQGRVIWTDKDKPKPIATCQVCGMTNLTPTTEGKE